MPLYDYKCPDCGHEEEKLIMFSKKDTALCIKCGAVSKRQFSKPQQHIIGNAFLKKCINKHGSEVNPDTLNRNAQAPMWKASPNDPNVIKYKRK